MTRLTSWILCIAALLLSACTADVTDVTPEGETGGEKFSPSASAWGTCHLQVEGTRFALDDRGVPFAQRGDGTSKGGWHEHELLTQAVRKLYRSDNGSWARNYDGPNNNVESDFINHAGSPYSNLDTSPGPTANDEALAANMTMGRTSYGYTWNRGQFSLSRQTAEWMAGIAPGSATFFGRSQSNYAATNGTQTVHIAFRSFKDPSGSTNRTEECAQVHSYDPSSRSGVTAHICLSCGRQDYGDNIFHREIGTYSYNWR